jgi:integrase
VTVDHVAVWSQGNEQALAPSTAWLALIAMNQICRYAARCGWIGVNPVAQLEPGEKPRWWVEHVRILEGADLHKLLAHAGAYRAMFEFLAYTGLRIGEALGLRWCDVDFEAAVLRVRQQLSRHRRPKHLKTEAAQREVVLAPAVTRLLRERWLASAYKAAEQLVFCKANGEGDDYRDAGKAFRAAVKAAGLQGQGRLSLHSLRHSFASLLISKRLNPVFVSRQLGHSSPTITLDVYAHLFEQADHAVAVREALEASYQAMASATGARPTPVSAGSR